MRPVILKCPSCQANLTVSRVACPDCGLSIDGSFELPPLLKLTSAQLDFVEIFVKNRGVIREVERELGVSYPTVRARLDEVIHALGFPIDDERDEPGAAITTAQSHPNDSARRRAVLEDLKQGRISPADALATLSGPRK